MDKYKFVEAVQALIRLTLERQTDIRGNYNMGLITFHEYMGQLGSLSESYDTFINTAAMECADEEKVSLDYLRGWCAHHSITF